MLPDSDNAPAILSELVAYGPVSIYVACQFPPPVRLVALWHSAMPATTVPKTPVHENSHALPAKHKVGVPWERLVTPPACETSSAKKGCQLQLGAFVAMRTHSSHYLAALCLSEHIGHDLKCS